MAVSEDPLGRADTAALIVDERPGRLQVSVGGRNRLLHLAGPFMHPGGAVTGGGRCIAMKIMEDEPLGIQHGAPLRLVAPAHYGYKNVKHITAIEFWRDSRNYRFPRPNPKLMDHPRAHVAFEERARRLPG